MLRVSVSALAMVKAELTAFEISRPFISYSDSVSVAEFRSSSHLGKDLSFNIGPSRCAHNTFRVSLSGEG